MAHTLEIEHQRNMAKYILRELNGNGFNAILAGGAVRDWYYGNPATDLDIFIAGEPNATQVCFLLGVDVQPLTEEKYTDSGFEGFECTMEGHKIQFLFHNVADPREVVYDFPVSASQCYWDGNTYWYSQLFQIGDRYEAIIGHWPNGKGFNDAYFCKIMDRLPGWRAHINLNTFFRSHFREMPSHRDMFIDF